MAVDENGSAAQKSSYNFTGRFHGHQRGVDCGSRIESEAGAVEPGPSILAVEVLLADMRIRPMRELPE